MKNFRIIIAFIIGMLLLSLSAYSQENLKKVYIIQTIAHPALDRTHDGIIAKLNAEGFIDGKNIELKFANAQGDIVLSNQIAQKFASNDPNIIVAIATSAAQSAKSATRNNNVPVVFSSVTDPIGAGLVKNLEQPGDNITGVSNFVNLSQQLELFKQILPNLSKLGFIYNPGEANSVKILESLKKEARLQNIEIIASVAGRTTEILAATNKLIGKVDAIFISNDNTALAAFGVITKTATVAKIPVFVSDTDMVVNGALAALGPNQYNLGTQTAKMIIAILNGKPVKELPVEFPNMVELVLNQKIADQLGIQLPADNASKAKKILR